MDMDRELGSRRLIWSVEGWLGLKCMNFACYSLCSAPPDDRPKRLTSTKSWYLLLAFAAAGWVLQQGTDVGLPTIHIFYHAMQGPTEISSLL
jgi:hypothetical protein